MSEGYIKLFRKLTEWEWYGDPNTFRLFIHLLINASFEENKWQGITIKPGQVVTGRKKLAKELKLSERQIRTSLNRLKSTSEIAIKSTNKFSIVTVCKWGIYQSGKDGERPTKQPTAGPTNDQQTTTTKEGKEFKEVSNMQKKDFLHKSDIEKEFERFWNYYDKKRNKAKCLKKYSKLSKADREAIKKHLPKYLESTPNKQYRKDPLTYLNNRSWEDEIILHKSNEETEQEKISRQIVDRYKQLLKGGDRSPNPGP